MEIQVLERPVGHVIARGSYDGGPDYEFIVAGDGEVYFQVVGDEDRVWAGPNAESFRRIAAAWKRFRCEVREQPTEAAQEKRVSQLREELLELGALPTDLPPDREPLWSLLVFEAENGLG